MSTEIYLGNPPENIVKWIKENYKPATPNYLCFTAEQAGSTIKMSKEGSAPTVYLETSPTGKDGSWSDFTVGSTKITLANVGDKVYFRAKQDNKRFGTEYSDSNYNSFTMTGKIAASGNLNTLLKADGSVLDLTGRGYCFPYMFTNCTSLTQAPELPATTLASYCYYNMFTNCTSLTQAPELPATTLADNCYMSMFQYCTSLTKAPVLLATTMAGGCYSGMFYGCSSLKQAPELPATTLASYCYYNMFNNCTSLTQAPELPATELVMECYTNIFRNCTHLTRVTSIAKIDYTQYNMFYSADNLSEITFTHMMTDEVVAIAESASIGLPNKQSVMCYCTDGIVVINGNNDLTGSGS